ncbi:MAG: S53 family peptidase [Ktedonobacterales bacterium]|nr:S53 family peptidase [Ktedonobacterales bacterium]
MRFWRLLAVFWMVAATLLTTAAGVDAHGRSGASTTARSSTARSSTRRSISRAKPRYLSSRRTTRPHVTSRRWSKGGRVRPMYRLVRRRATTSYQSGFSPQQVQSAYSLGGGLDGSGITIAIVTAYDDPTAARDFDVFSTQFGLPTIAGGCGCFTKVNQTGGTTYPRADATWALEASLDIEWAHALAPGARILLVEGNSDDFSVIVRAEDYATSHAQVVSNSWGEAEFSGESAYDYHFNKPVAITVAAGDTGTPAEYPSASPYVISVGGTTLTLQGASSGGSCDGGCFYGGERAWSGSGGGASAYERQPAYQSGLCSASMCHGKRGTPDVAWLGDTSQGVAIYDSTKYAGSAGWWDAGGTSVGAPSIAALIALIDQAFGKQVSNRLDSRFFYSLYRASGSGGGAFHDITAGSNGKKCCAAAQGYDLASGLGSPIGTAWLNGG